MRNTFLKPIKVTLVLLGAVFWLGANAARAEETAPGLVFSDTTGAKRFLPLKSTSVRIHVTGGVAESEVTQTFTNDTQTALEAVYLFPLPSGATVTDMELRYADRVIRSVVKEKEEARKTYEQARTDGKKAALVEEERPNMFTTSVTNFLPGETVEVHFRCIFPLEFEAGAYALNFPMTVGPRYVPSDTLGEAGRIVAPILLPSVDPVHRLDLVVDIRGIPVSRIDSSTHSIQISQIEPGVSEVKLASGSTIPNCDFGLRIGLATGDAPVVTTLQSDDGKARYAMINIYPPLTAKLLENNPLPRDVLFLIDTSGSMEGDSIGQAKAGLLQCLGMLRPEDHFDIVRFSDAFSSFAPELRPVDSSTLEAGRSFVNTLVADGGTEMQPALDYVLGLKSRPEAMRLVVFLTDGDVGNEETLLRLIHARLGNARLFTFAIGSAPNEYLIREMAKLGRGEARTIQSHEDIERVMQDFFRTLDAPVLTDAELIWKGPHGRQLNNVEFYPARLPDLFRDRPVRVFAKLPAGFHGEVTVRANALGHRFEETLSLGTDHASDSSALEKLFGRARLDDLMVQWMTAKDGPSREGLRLDVIATALEHQLITQFTSRVAVEEKISRNPLDKLISGKVPLPLPRGWDPSQFVPTGTDDLARLLGAALLGVFAALCRWFPKSKK